MSQSQLSALLAHLENDAKLMAAFRACTSAAQSAVLAQQAGFSISEEEILDYLDDQEVELTADQLANVAGGVNYGFPPLWKQTYGGIYG
ncbi:MAG: Nif11 domain [Cyanobacteriota bacterium]|jgi:predicted ribosomally synthesized peptide with nif11-like leader